MQTLNLTNLSYDELDELERTLDQERKRRLYEEHTALFKQAEELATRHGLTLDDVFNPPVKKRAKAKPRYINPDNAEETWTGLGKRPRWLVQKIDGGHTLEEFVIESSIDE